MRRGNASRGCVTAIVPGADLAEGVGRRSTFRERTRPVPAPLAEIAGVAEDGPSTQPVASVVPEEGVEPSLGVNRTGF